MTRWKKAINEHGFKMEKDLPMVPFNEILGIFPVLKNDGIHIITEYTFMISEAVIKRNGAEHFIDCDLVVREV